MRKLFVSVAALALTAGAALAADLPSRKGPPMLPPPPPPPPMWTGFYAGLNAGYGFGTNDNTQNASIALAPYNIYGYGGYPYLGNGPYPAMQSEGSGLAGLGAGLALSGYGPMTQSGFIGGGQVGYNYQWGPSFVIGLEADIQGTGIRGTSYGVGIGADSGTYFSNGNYDAKSNGNYDRRFESTATGATRVNAGVDWMGTVRGRLGYLFTPTMLVYATGGLTYGGVYANVTQYANASTNYFRGNYPDDFGVNHTFIGGGNKSQTLVGWNVGGGIEWMFMPNWSLKAEGLYWNMGNMNVPTAAFAAAPVSIGNRGGLMSVQDIGGGAPPFATDGVTTYGATRVNYQGVIARAGVNYHFNWFAPAPVVAKY
jgi:outer membrane immunogenic protein